MANNHIYHTPFLLDRENVLLVKPSKPTSLWLLSLSSIDNDPHLEIFCQTIHVYQSNVDSSYYDNHNCTSSFDGQVDITYVIKETLSKALVFYYPLIGKLEKNSDGKLHINCNEDGVPFLVATANYQLSSLNYLDGVDVEVSKQLVLDLPSKGDSVYHPLVLQVTKFSCGGCTIGMGLSHSVCDGFGAAQFFRALVELASGKSELLVKPMWERERLMATSTKEPFQLMFLDEPYLVTSPYMPTTDLLHKCFHVSSESIENQNEFDRGIQNRKFVWKFHHNWGPRCHGRNYAWAWAWAWALACPPPPPIF